ncbi:hypothetical protein ES703_47635 [subsurface metagenome]
MDLLTIFFLTNEAKKGLYNLFLSKHRLNKTKEHKTMRKIKVKNRIRQYRQLLQLTQEDLAKAIGSYQIKIGRYERADIRTPEEIKEKIASVLGLPLTVVFPEDEERRRRR